MKKHISYPSIEQFRNVVAAVNRSVGFAGLDENGDAIYVHDRTKPTLTFTGTVKLHGTNASVCMNSVSGMWAQSREDIITVESDNAGFAWFVKTNEKSFQSLIYSIAEKENIDLTTNTISIYGEWVGKRIQKGVGVCELEKSFFVFGVKVSPFDSSISAYWIDCKDVRDTSNRIFNIYDYETFSVDIDFNNPHLVQNELVEITNRVEQECPVAKAFGIIGIGEGVVWSATFQDASLRFKVKGEKHQSSKIKKLVTVDVERIDSLKSFAEYAITDSRYEQAIEKVFGSKDKMDIKRMGDFLKWIVTDVNKEEFDTMAENGFEPKDVNKYLSVKAREMFLKDYNDIQNPIA